MVQVYLGLGTNLGEQYANLETAISKLSGCVKKIKISSVYQTFPMYHKEQPLFLNQVVTGFTQFEPLELLRQIKRIESEMGRVTTFVAKGPRLIDIDILLYGRKNLNLPQLKVPHPLMYERQFVLIPLLELNPEISDPFSGKPFKQFLTSLPDQGVKKTDH